MNRALTPLLVILYAAMCFERALELALNRHNTRRLAARGAVWLTNDGFGLILAAQLVLFGGTTIETIAAPWSGENALTWISIGGLALAQALRYWCILTLGERWNIRVVTIPGAPRVVSGPYRFFPHPNYLAVASEAILMPLAFGAYATLAIAAPLQVIAIWRRIRSEEGALSRASSASEARA